MRLLMINLWRT